MVKPYKTIYEQIDLFIKRRLSIDDKNSAKHLLSIISYYRLSSYRFPIFNKATDSYLEGYSIENLKILYEMDTLYKSFLYYILQFIEVTFRTLSVNTFSKNDPYFYIKKENFIFNGKQDKLRKSQFFEKLNKDINNTNNIHISFYQEKHDEEINKKVSTNKCNYRKNNCKVSYAKCSCIPEAWVAFESFDFGQLIQIYAKLKKEAFQDKKEDIARFFSTKNKEITHKDLLNMLEDIKRIRNIIAHHDKIIDRYSFKPSKSIDFLKFYYQNNNQIITILNNPNKYRNTFLPYFLVIKYFIDIIFSNNKLFLESEGINMIKYFLIMSKDKFYKTYLSLENLDDSIFDFRID